MDLTATPWEDDEQGIRARAIRADGRRWAIVEYGPGAQRGDWCTGGHRGYVLAGAIEYEFDDGGEPLSLSAGQAFRLAAGGRGHRGRNVGSAPTTLFLIDDPS